MSESVRVGSLVPKEAYEAAQVGHSDIRDRTLAADAINRAYPFIRDRVVEDVCTALEGREARELVGVHGHDELADFVRSRFGSGGEESHGE